LTRITAAKYGQLSKRITNYTYYPNGLLRETIQSSGSNVKYHYDNNGNLIKTESLRENGIYDIAKYEYDSENRVKKAVQLVDEDSILTEGIDDVAELRDSEYPDKINIITGYEYDLLGNRTKVISPKAYGCADEEAGAGYAVTYSYDILNRLERIGRKYNGSEVSVRYFYDEAGNKVKEINEKDLETVYTYDSMNRIESMTDTLGKTYEYGYDPAGNKTYETNPKGDTISYSYDKLNRVIEVIDPYGKVINRKVYDEKGNIIKDIDAKGYLSGETDVERYGIEYEYDLAGRIVKTIDPEGGQTKYEYSQYGELAKHTDALGNTSQYEYDNAGKLVKVTDALGIATKYTWDKAGNKLTMTDGRGKITKYCYGSFGLLISYIDADEQETVYKYDLSLAVAAMKDRNGNETIYSYDNRGLLTEKKVPETGDTVSYTYDVLGNRETMTDDTGTSIYAYNGNNWLISIEKDGELQISYAYDDIGNIASVTDKLGNATEYTYDRSSRMESVSFEGRTIEYEYDENGNRKSIDYDGEVEEAYTYDKNNRLLELVNRKAGGGIISSYSYTYDKAGRQTSRTDSYGTTEYTYDKAGRILKVEAPGKTTVYTYDGAGNRISQDETYTSEQILPAIDGTGLGEIKYIVKRSEYVYGNTNRLLKLVEKLKNAGGMELLQKITSFRYDDNGNELRRTVEYISLYNKENPKVYEAAVYDEETTEPIHAVVDQTVSKYDGFNRLVRTEIIRGGVKTTVEYAYNGDGLRTEKTVRRSNKGNAAETTSYLYDRQHVILEARGNDEIRYVRGINYIARIDNTDKLSYFLYNGHGDVAQTVSEDGEIENQYDYDIFGNPTLTVENYQNSIRYAGEFYDAETGLYYLRARYYDPYIGRFISEDSYWGEDTNPLSLNLYTYCENDPINFIDPTGHSKIDDIIKEIDSEKDKWWKEANSGRGGLGQKDWNQAQRDANKRANELRDELARLEKGNKEVEKLGKSKGDDAGDWERYKYKKEVERSAKDGKVDREERKKIERRLEELTAAEAYGVNVPGVNRNRLKVDFGVSSIDELVNVSKDSIRFINSSGNRDLWKRVGKDVGIAEIENRRHPSIHNQEVLSDAKHNRGLGLTSEQVAFAALEDIHGVRDYLAPSKKASAGQNESRESLRNEVYEILTGKESRYHKNIAGQWTDINRPDSRNNFTEFLSGSIVSDADMLLNRYSTTNVDLFRMTDAVIKSAAAIMSVRYILSEIAPVAEYYRAKFSVWKQGLNPSTSGFKPDLQLFGDNATQGEGSKGYQTPNGGGGITNSIKTGNGTVTFGHGGRHVTGVDISSVEQTIANKVPKLGVGERYTGTVNVNGINIEYRAYGVSEGVTNVGTYYPLP